MSCDKNDNPLSVSKGNSENSACASSNSGNAYLCSDFQAKPVSDNLSIGFAVTDGSENCCKCFELTWTSGPSVGKKMQVQIINEGGSTDDGREFIILTPGGGVGPNVAGCNKQFGYDW